MARQVFISHSHVDVDVAEKIRATLEQAGIPCWISTRDILPGAVYGKAIIEGIQETSVLLLVFSGHSNDSPQVAREVERAVSLRKVILPFRLQNLPPGPDLEYFLSLTNWLNAFPKPWEDYLDALTRAVKGILAPSVSTLETSPRNAPVSAGPKAAIPESPPSYKFWAYISSAHVDGKAWPAWIQMSLESFRVPARLVGRDTGRDYPVPVSLNPVFRGWEELPESDVPSNLDYGLCHSRFLVVVCSPSATKSAWPNMEICRFKALGREKQIIALIVAGEPFASDKPGQEKQECLPEALRHRVDRDGRILPEKAPVMIIDARNPERKDNARLRLVAAILGVGYRELGQDGRHHRLLGIITTSVFALVALVLAMSFYLLFFKH